MLVDLMVRDRALITYPVFEEGRVAMACGLSLGYIEVDVAGLPEETLNLIAAKAASVPLRPERILAPCVARNTTSNGLRIRQRASQATDLKGNWSEKPRFRALSVQCPEKYRLWA
jgi:hypothetical protein